MAFAIVLLLGPGDQEIERTTDLFRSILAYEPKESRGADVFLVNDGNANVDALDRVLKPFRRCFHLRNPLAGEIAHPHPRCAAGMIRGLSHVARQQPYRYALKLDTDALVINPFHQKLSRFFETHPGVGVAGSYLRFPDETPRLGIEAFSWRLVETTRRGSILETLRKDPLRAPKAFSRILQRRRIFMAARQKGYRAGYHVQGGSYAVSGTALRAWARHSMDSHELLFRDALIGEDVIVSLFVSRMGLELADFNAPGEVFGVWWQKLGAAPEVLLERYSIIHSLKSYDGQDEQELRAIFRRRRKAASPAIAASE